MKNRIWFHKFTAISILLIIWSATLYADVKRRIVVFGSSVAAGWVTSYNEQYDMQNGYAYRLRRNLGDCEVIVNCVPGDNTQSSLRRIQEDLLDLKPDYALIGLAMANEGLGRAPVDSVTAHYRKGLKKIIALCRESGIEPIVGLCYPNDSFNEDDYAAVRAMNIEVAQWDVPTINFLGALDDGHCHFPEGTTYEGDHPENLGHEEMFYAIEPQMFRVSPAWNRRALNPAMGKEYRDGQKDFSYTPDCMMHSFTFTFDCEVMSGVHQAIIEGVQGYLLLSWDRSGLDIQWNDKQYTRVAAFDRKEPIRITVSQYYLDERIEVYANDRKVRTIEARTEPLAFTLRAGDGVRYANAGVYRSAMNREEIEKLCDGTILNGSLCAWSNFVLEDSGRQYHNAVPWNEIDAGVRADSGKKDALREQYLVAREARASQPVFPEKTFITLSGSELMEYVGEYEISADDHMELKVVDGELRLFDHGQSIALRAESRDHFFVKAPYTFLVDFERVGSVITQMTITVMGNQLSANRCE